jgi:hypothetical protein
MATPTSLQFNGITYTLTELNVSGLTAGFEFTISGENTASDTEATSLGPRTGINAIAFSTPGGNSGVVASATMTAPPTGWNFMPGGINSAGCNGNGAFYCFDNTAIDPTKPATIPTTPLAGTLTFDFNVTLNAGNSWASYTDGNPNDLPHLKIDWVSPTANNYNLVSTAIPVNDAPPPPVPEPASIAILGVGLFGIGFVASRKRSA